MKYEHYIFQSIRNLFRGLCVPAKYKTSEKLVTITFSNAWYLFSAKRSELSQNMLDEHHRINNKYTNISYVLSTSGLRKLSIDTNITTY